MKLLITFLMTSTLVFAGSSKKASPQICELCQMEVTEVSPYAFFAKEGDKTTPLCSFYCAHGFMKRSPNASLTAVDYSSKKMIDAKKAFFIVKSKVLDKEMTMGMPPTVVAFESKDAALAKTKQIGDGVVIEGFENIQKALQQK